LIRNRPIIIQDMALSKLHSAILTTDPESNLYICGFGPGGRLGTGDETTKFNYVCIEGGGLAGKKIVSVALGQNHSIVASELGEVFTWGTNTWGQLGYSLPRPVSSPLFSAWFVRR
jgi:alpha-tubulin suppressor-like RCC1 family protein